MAIEKVKKRKMELTTGAVVCFSVAAVLFLVSGILILSSIGRFRLKMNLTKALSHYASNRLGEARLSATAAIDVDGENRSARTLRAKMSADSGSLDEAERDYQQLIEQDDTSAVRCGMGVVYLRKADQASDFAAAEPLLKKAQEHFAAAKSRDANRPEASIGLAQVLLLSAVKSGDTTQMEKAREAFQRLKSDMTSSAAFRQTVTADGLIDLYTGLGRVFATPDAYSPEAADAFHACRIYAQGWALPLSNSLNMEALKYATKSWEARELIDRLTELNQTVEEYRRLMVGQRNQYAEIKRAWVNLAIAIPAAIVRAGRGDAVQSRIAQLRSDAEMKDMPDPLLLDVYSKMAPFLATPPGETARRKLCATQARATIDAVVVQAAMKDERLRPTLAMLWNNLGVLQEYLGSLERNPHAPYSDAKRCWTELLKIDPGSYLANRNLAVMHWKWKKTADVPAFLEAARKAAATEEQRADFERVAKVLQQP